VLLAHGERGATWAAVTELTGLRYARVTVRLAELRGLGWARQVPGFGGLDRYALTPYGAERAALMLGLTDEGSTE
jgi:DNA-binding IclR family transcriptional regulator